MELNRKHIRVIIFYNFRRGLTQQQCMDELNSIFGDEAPSRTNIYRWYDEFSRDHHSSLQDEFHEGCSKFVVVSETIDWQLILHDRHVTYRQIEHTFSMAWTFGLLKKFVCVGSHTICQSLKKTARVEKNAPKIRSR